MKKGWKKPSTSRWIFSSYQRSLQKWMEKSQRRRLERVRQRSEQETKRDWDNGSATINKTTWPKESTNNKINKVLKRTAVFFGRWQIPNVKPIICPRKYIISNLKCKGKPTKKTACEHCPPSPNISTIFDQFFLWMVHDHWRIAILVWKK